MGAHQELVVIEVVVVEAMVEKETHQQGEVVEFHPEMPRQPLGLRSWRSNWQQPLH